MRRKRTDLACSHCQRLFSKPEHLKRHARVHDGSKPYTCPHPSCDKQFKTSRSDSLARHIKSHKEDFTRPLDISQQSDESLGLAHGSSPAAATVSSTVAMMAHEQHEQDLPPSMDSEGTVQEYSMYDDGIGSMAFSSSEDLFAFLMGDPILSSFNTQAGADVPISHDPRGTADRILQEEQHHASQAVQNMSSLVQEFSFNLSREIESLGVTAEFLDTSLDSFFVHLLPIFPVLHAATFSVKDCLKPLLLNMIALGSLFVASDSATAMGDALWRVAQAAVGTSWQELLERSTVKRKVTGMQLVLTSLFGQAYAILSGNRSLRLTSQLSRGQGFYWAKQCDLLPSTSDVPMSTDMLDAEAKNAAWRQWAAEEVQNRALLGHYILDSLISQSSGLPSSARHMINGMPLPCSDEAFDAPTADQWHRIMTQEPPLPRTTFRETLLSLFNGSLELSRTPLSHMSVPLILEYCHFTLMESREAGGPSVGLPSEASISHVLWLLYESQINVSSRPIAATIDLSIRWHVVCINLCVSPQYLIQDLCRRYGVQQKIYSGAGNAPPIAGWEAWRSCHLMRRAMLHATAVLELSKQLSVSDLKALHLPVALHTAGIVLAAAIVDGPSRVHLPDPTCWRSVCQLETAARDPTLQSRATAATLEFLHGGAAGPDSSSRARNLLVDINSLQMMLGSTSSPWGISREMRESLAQLMSARAKRT